MARTFTLDDGTKVCGFGRGGMYIPDDGTPERFPGTFEHKRHRGIAWRILGAEVELCENEWQDDDGRWYTDPDWRETGRVVFCMVGYDRPEAFDMGDFVPIGEDDYCHVCGQVGCTHDGRDREED